MTAADDTGSVNKKAGPALATKTSALHSKNHVSYATEKLWETFLPLFSDIATRNWFAWINIIVYSLQSMAIVFSDVNVLNWHHGYATWLEKATSEMLLEVETFSSLPAFYVMSSILATFIVAFLATFVLRWYGSSQWVTVTSRLASWTYLIIIGIGFLPMMSHYGSMLTCHIYQNEAYVEQIGCWSKDLIAYKVISIIALIILLVIIPIGQCYFCEQVADEKSVQSKAHGRIDAFDNAVKGILTCLVSALNGYANTNSNIRWFLNIITIVGFCCTAWMYSRYCPYYHRSFRLIHISVNFFLLWSAISMTMLQVFPSQGYEAIMYLYFGGTGAIFLGNWSFVQRCRHLLDTPLEKISNQYAIELKLRTFLQSQSAFWTTRSDVVGRTKPDIDPDLMKQVRAMLTQAFKICPQSSLLYLTYASFLLGKSNLNYCLTVFSKARRVLKLDFDIAFHIYRQSIFIERVFSKQKGTNEVRNYFSFLSLSRQTDRDQKIFLAKKLALLSELRKSTTNSARLQSLSRSIYELLTSIQRNHQRMFSLNPNPKVLRHYATFVSNILGNPTLTRNIVEFAEKMETEQSNSEYDLNKRSGIESQAALFDERNAVLLISGEEENLGEILEVNMGAVDIFGFAASSEIIGLNINQLMPSPFSESHCNYLRKYLETGFASVLDTTRTVIARDKLGFIFEIQLYVRQIVGHHGDISFIGVISRVEEQPEHIILDPTGHISGISRDCVRIFKLDEHHAFLGQDELSTRLNMIHISTWISGWEQNKAQFEQDQGHTIPFQDINMTIKIQDLRFVGSQFTVLNMWIEDTKYSLNDLRPDAIKEQSKSAVRQDASLLPKIEIANNEVLKSAIMVEDTTPASMKTAILEEDDQLLVQNTARNMIISFEMVMEEYKKRFAKRDSASGDSLLFWFKMFCSIFLAWLIISCFVYRSTFKETTLCRSGIAAEGIRNVEVLRSTHGIRSMAITTACNSNTTSSCVHQSIQKFSAKNEEKARKLVHHSTYALAEANQKLLDDYNRLKANQYYLDDVAPLWMKNSIPIGTIRFDLGIVQTPSNYLEAANEFLMYSDFLVRYPSVYPLFPGNASDMVLQPDVEYLNWIENNPNLPRATFFVISNYEHMLEHIDAARTANAKVYSAALGEISGKLMQIAIIPTVLFSLAFLLYIIPQVKKLMDWQNDIMTTISSIPRSLIQWWYNVAARRLEEDVKAEDDGISAELYLMVQQGIEGVENSSEDKHKKSNSSKEGKNNPASASSKTAIRRTAIVANRAHRLLITQVVIGTLLLAAMPLLSLLGTKDLEYFKIAGHRIDWTFDMVAGIFETQTSLREVAIAKFFRLNNGANTVDLDAFIAERLEKARKAALKANTGARHLFYGMNDGEVSCIGLSDEPSLQFVVFNDACSIVSSDLAERSVTNQTCKEYRNGIMSQGLNHAMLTFSQKSEEVWRQLSKSQQIPVNELSTIAEKLADLEELMSHIWSVSIALIPHIEHSAETAENWFMYTIQTVQVIVAFIGAIILYLQFYVPLIKRIERDARNLHTVLMLLWSTTEQYAQPVNSAASEENIAPSKGGPCGSLVTFGEQKEPPMFGPNGTQSAPLRANPDLELRISEETFESRSKRDDE